MLSLRRQLTERLTFCHIPQNIVLALAYFFEVVEYGSWFGERGGWNGPDN